VESSTKVMVFWKRGARELKSKMHELKPKVNFTKIKNCGVSFHSDIEVVDGERAKKKVSFSFRKIMPLLVHNLCQHSKRQSFQR
jgi:hypothetical protein